MGSITAAAAQGLTIETAHGIVTIEPSVVHAVYLANKAEEVATHNAKAKRALAAHDMATFAHHAALYHKAASEHDAVTGGSIRDQYV